MKLTSDICTMPLLKPEPRMKHVLIERNRFMSRDWPRHHPSVPAQSQHGKISGMKRSFSFPLCHHPFPEMKGCEIEITQETECNPRMAQDMGW